MKILLTICIALMTLFCGTAAAAPQEDGRSTMTHVVKKGETLSAIVKKFPKATVAALAKQNNIADPDLIYPGTVLTFSRTDNAALSVSSHKVSAGPARIDTQKHVMQRVATPVSQKHTVKSTCNAAPIISRLDYPVPVNKQLEALMTAHTAAQKGFPFRGVVSHGGNEYHLLLDEHCIVTKIIDRPNSIAGTDRTQENTAALTPRPGVTIAKGGTGAMGHLSDAEMGVFLARIKNELQTIMGPGEDVSSLVIPLALAVLHRGETGEAVLSWLKKTGEKR